MSDKRATPIAGVQSTQPIAPLFSPNGKWIAYTAVENDFAGGSSMTPVDMAPDGRILGEIDADQGKGGFSGTQEFQQMRVVLKWHEELKRLVPTK